MHNSVSINLNVLEEQRKLNERTEANKTKIFYSGSACMYPEHNQLDPDNPDCREESAYPANPDSEYGWENSSQKDFTLLITAITVFLFVFLGIITSSDPKEPGREEERESACKSAVKSLTSWSRVEQSRCGEITDSFLPVH